MPSGGARKGAGRKKGSTNKVNTSVADVLQGIGFDPIVEMVGIFNDPESSLELKHNVCKELAQYIAPKRKAVELSTGSDHQEWLDLLSEASNEKG